MKPIGKGRMRQAVRVAFAAGIATGAAQAGATDIWLRIPGIAGESVVADHKGEIDVISFNNSLDAKTCQLVIGKFLDSATPGLAEAAAKRATLPNVTLSARKSGEGQKDFLTITLLGTTVASVESGASNGDAVPREQIVLSPRSVSVSYRPQDFKGGLGPAVTSTYTCDGK